MKIIIKSFLIKDYDTEDFNSDNSDNSDDSDEVIEKDIYLTYNDLLKSDKKTINKTIEVAVNEYKKFIKTEYKFIKTEYMCNSFDQLITTWIATYANIYNDQSRVTIELNTNKLPSYTIKKYNGDKEYAWTVLINNNTYKLNSLYYTKHDMPSLEKMMCVEYNSEISDGFWTTEYPVELSNGNYVIIFNDMDVVAH